MKNQSSAPGSTPPLVIMVDLILILLLVVLLNPKKGVVIDIEDGVIPPDFLVVTSQQGQLLELDPISGREVGYPFLASRPTGLINTVHCKSPCASYQYKNPQLVLPDAITADILRLTFAALHENFCDSLAIHINARGEIDKERFLYSNSCVEQVPGIEQFLN